MKLTIIPVDNFVSIDKVGYNDIDMSSIEDGIHAVQWYDTYGVIEYSDRNRRNERFEDISKFNDVIELYRIKSLEEKRNTPPSYEPIWDWSEESLSWIESQEKKEAFELAKEVSAKKGFLVTTDWVVVKMNEIVLLGGDVEELLEKYSDVMEERRLARIFINEKEA